MRVTTSGNPKRPSCAATSSEYFRLRSVEKTLRILEVLAETPGMSIGDIALSLSLTKSNVHRILLTLKENGYVEQDSTGITYSLSLKLFQIGCSVQNRFDIVSVIKPLMENLSSLSNETINLGVIYRNGVFLLDKIVSPSALRLDSPMGGSDPLHTTALGKCLLAGMNDIQLEAFLRSHPLERCTKNTITDPEVLRAVVRNVRELGFAIDDEETLEGVYCIAAPIRNERGAVVAAVSISAPKLRMTEDRTEAYRKVLMENCREISAKIGIAV